MWTSVSPCSQDNAAGGTIYVDGGEGTGNAGASGGDLKLTGGGSASTAGCDVGMYTCAGQLVSATVYRAFLKVGWCKLNPVEASVDSAWFQRSKLRYEEPLSNCSFKFNVRRYFKGCSRIKFGSEGNSLCDGVIINETDYTAMATGPCEQQCAGGGIEIGGGASVMGAGGDVSISGGSSASSSPGSGGGNVLISGGSGVGTAAAGGTVVLTSGSGGDGQASGDTIVSTGRAVQVDLIKPKLKLPGTRRLKVKCGEPLSTFAFKFKLRRYRLGAGTAHKAATFS